jgi:hypothetical protein
MAAGQEPLIDRIHPHRARQNRRESTTGQPGSHQRPGDRTGEGQQIRLIQQPSAPALGLRITWPIGVLEEAARTSLAKAGLQESAIDWLIPHQANIRIMQSTARKLKVPMEKVVVTVDQHGNTSAASIPLALDLAVRDGRIQRGQTLMLEGVGGGFTWGSVLVKY